jgi:hypothetical protein
VYKRQETLEEIRTQTTQGYKRHREVEVRERERIEADADGDTKTTTKMWKRKNKGKKKQVPIETHTRLRGPRGVGFSHGLDPPQPPTSAGGYRGTRCGVAGAHVVRAARNERWGLP